MPDGDCYAYRALPTKVLDGVPHQHAYRCKLEAKWRRKGYAVRFAGETP